MRREVLPYAQDAWYVEKSIRIGYEISFNRYFHKPEPMRTLTEIGAEIVAVEREAEGLLAGLSGIKQGGEYGVNPVVQDESKNRVSRGGISEFGAGR